MNNDWNASFYAQLLQNDELTSQEQKQLSDYRRDLYTQLCYNSKSDFTSYVNQYLYETLDPDEFRQNFIWLCVEFLNLVGDIEQDPSQLSNFIIDYDLKLPFFNFKQTILTVSLTIVQEPDSNIMSESDFQTLVARSYYEYLISEDA
jgi:hypothetical protein